MALQSSPKIVIVGAGLGGLALSLSLKSYGISSTIFELRPNPAINHDSNTDGGYLALAPNALRVLDRLGVYKLIQPQGYSYDEMHFLSARNMSLLGAVRTGSGPYGGYRALRISRHILRRTLLDKVAEQGIEVKYNCKLVDVQDESSNGKEGDRACAIKATFSNGNVEQADYVIGADGIHSRVRRLVDPNAAEPTFSGQIGLGGEVELAKLSSDNQETTMPCMIMGAANSFACIPIASDGSRLGCFATIEEVNRSRSEWNDLAMDKTGLLQMLQQAHCGEKNDWPSFVQESCIKMNPESMALWPFHKAPKLDTWISSSGRVILIGDAAHAIPPTGGQGAAMAFEDAASLGLAFANEFKMTPTESSFTINSSQFPNLETWLSTRRSRIEKIVAFTDRGGKMRKATPSLFMQIVKEWGMWLFFWIKGKDAGLGWIYTYDVHA